MNIHDNKFSAKSTGGTALNLNTNKTDEIGAYLKYIIIPLKIIQDTVL